MNNAKFTSPDRRTYLCAALACLTSLIALCGCATCRQHPMACGVAAGVIATSIALSVDGGHHHRKQSCRVPPPDCAGKGWCEPGPAIRAVCQP